jgi:hypothetical protein
LASPLASISSRTQPQASPALFDLAGRDATNVCLYELTRIHGSCRDTSTLLALELSVLIDKEVGDDVAGVAQEFAVSAGAKPKSLGETLPLSGGPGGGDWKWGTTALPIGATAVNAQHRGPPCPNCACGRKAAAVAEA